MKHLIKFTILLLTFLMPVITSAHDFEVDGIYYNISGNQATVTFKGNYSSQYANEYNCEEINIPTTVTYNNTTYPVTAIGTEAFEECAISCVIIPNSVTSIGDYAFYRSGLTRVIIPGSVTSIGNEAFCNCDYLRYVYSYIVDPSLISMGSDVFLFYHCSLESLGRELYVPNGSFAAYNADNNWIPYFYCLFEMDPEPVSTNYTFNYGEFQFITTSDSTVTVTGYNNYDSWDYYMFIGIDIEIPSHVTYNNIDYTVTAIGDNAFDYIYCITIPNTIVSIGKSAIHGIYDYNYYVVCLAETPPAMNESFNPNNGTELFVLEDAYPLYKEINDNNHYFSSIHITNGERTDTHEIIITELTQDYALAQYGIYDCGEGEYSQPNIYGCFGKFNSNNNVHTTIIRIIEETPSSSTPLSSYDITGEGHYNGNGDYCFYYENESEFDPRNLIIISNSIEIGKSPSHINYQSVGPGGEKVIHPKWYPIFSFCDSGIAYNTCNNSVAVTFGSFHDRPRYRQVFAFYSGNVVIPDVATEHNYYNDTHITYPVTAIGETAFSDNYYKYTYYNIGWTDYLDDHLNDYLNSVTLPASIESIGWYAFGKSPNLAYIKCLGLIPPITSIESRELEYNPDVVINGSFDEGVLQNTTLYVPMAALSAYRTAEGWKDFQNIVGFVDYDFVADGIYYLITGDNEVMVTSGENAYQGIISIPTNVTYDVVTYDVTGISDGAFADATLQSLIIPVTISYIGNTAFNNCHIGSLVISGNGTWSAGAINCEVDNLYVMSTVTGIQDLQVNPASTVYSYSTLPPTCNEQTFTGYDAELHVPASALAAYFTAPYWNNFINITSDAVEPTGLTINKDSVDVLIGTQLTLAATHTPDNATPTDILWTSSDESIATVADGIITAVHVGECDITAYLLDKTAVCHVTVTEIAPTQITLNQEFAKLEVDSQLTLTATISPDDATDKYVTWATTNSAVATVDSLGNVLAVGTGECFITATCRDKQAMCHIIVVDHFIFITLDEHEVSLLPNHMIVLTPSVMPENTSLVVTSSNPNVAAARLANGKIQVVGITEGRTIIKVNSTDGYAEADSCLVKVYTLRGDVNNDGYVNISDVTSLINHLLGGQDIINEVNADTNNDGKINISDVTRLINYLLGGDELDPTEEPIEGAETFTVNGVAFTMLPVEGGTFSMGCSTEQDENALSDEMPIHLVTLSSFYMGQTEVTQELWQAVMENNPSHFKTNPQYPVENITWNDCQQFISRLNELTGKNFRLPTEAEWEYAALGGNQSNGFTFAGSNNIDEVAWYLDNSENTTHVVGMKKPNELGLYDMTGNVCEWCSDRYGYYSEEPQTDPTGPETGSSRIYRGGSWQKLAVNCRITRRNYFAPGAVRNYMGLRLVLQ